MTMVGIVWGAVLYFIYMGTFWYWVPKEKREWILGWKYGALILDLVVTFVGAKALSAFSGSMTAGIATVTLCLLCFITSLLVSTSRKLKSDYKKFKTAKPLKA